MNNYNFIYDNTGNQLIDNTERCFEWDAANRLLLFKNQIGSSEPSLIAQYLYDSAGNRVKKIVRKQGGNYDIRTYIDGIFEYFTDEIEEQNTVHVMDDQSRVVMIRIGDAMGDTTPAVKYNLENNIYSSTVTLDDNGTIVNSQEYYPFGETSFGSYAKKRYQYVGKERDEESGLYYYGARYYTPWLARFISCDPLSAQYTQLSSYNYSDNNPINDYDIDGMQNNNTPKTENRTGNDPNSDAEKTYRADKVKELLKEGVKLHNIHFVYDKFANTNGDVGDVTYSYTKEYGADKEFVVENWYHQGQRSGLSRGKGERFDPNEPKKVEKKLEDPQDNEIFEGTQSQAGKEEDPLPKKNKLSTEKLNEILDSGEIVEQNGGGLFNLQSNNYWKLVVNQSNQLGSALYIKQKLSSFDFEKIKISILVYIDKTFNAFYNGEDGRKIIKNDLEKGLNSLVGPKIQFEVWFTLDPTKSTGHLKGWVLK